MIGPYATGAGELRQDRKVAAVSHAFPGAVGQPGLSLPRGTAAERPRRIWVHGHDFYAEGWQVWVARMGG